MRHLYRDRADGGGGGSPDERLLGGDGSPPPRGRGAARASTPRPGGWPASHRRMRCFADGGDRRGFSLRLDRGGIYHGQGDARFTHARIWMGSPGIRFERHKGYGTPADLELLRRLGPTALRRSFPADIDVRTCAIEPGFAVSGTARRRSEFVE
jgi:hypothetical protein